MDPGPPPDGAPVGRSRPAQVTPLSLLERARANDADAWRRLMDLYRPIVLFWCARAGLRAEDAEDVTQGAFAAAAAGLGGFRRDREGDTFRGWLRAVTRNQVLLHFRRNKGQPQAEGGSDAWQSLQSVADPIAAPDDAEEAEVGQIYPRARGSGPGGVRGPHLAGLLDHRRRGPLPRLDRRRTRHEPRRRPPGQVARPPPPQTGDGRTPSDEPADHRSRFLTLLLINHLSRRAFLSVTGLRSVRIVRTSSPEPCLDSIANPRAPGSIPRGGSAAPPTPAFDSARFSPPRELAPVRPDMNRKNSASAKSRHRRETSRFRPGLDVCEARTLLSTFTVTNLNDGGAGSLRQAILNANGNSGADTIKFQSGLSGTIALGASNGPLVITDPSTSRAPARARSPSPEATRPRTW